MTKVRYMISDAAKLVDVEAHVLRYWEEELELDILRNEMGHRYYTEENIRQFKKIKELKEQGFQLKAIKMLIIENDLSVPMESKKMKNSPNVTAAQSDKMKQFQAMMNSMIAKALLENSEQLSKEVGQHVSSQVIKEMDYLLRLQDEQDEKRFQKINEALHSKKGEQVKKEVKNSVDDGKKKKKFGFLRKEGKVKSEAIS
ncbi:MerR family transcriptional regulator [Anaerosacchariphilus polymeriproducens]|uniref:MerR family transcriptional regulator n=1 Tax=Anaerosacchariphilus polymeriproducens TaxID=1812858 RepID=A0A371AY11_9FIRM|nr:MerR family transcriptional regulator [Anaerosacchariphilus polymeriproducens]RDU24453.1 MerR family transcriptional regulator [Anaerosacchariphilus polymeriproducens]